MRSTRTAVGEVGVLANHTPLLAALRPTELRLHVTESETKRYAQAHGWMQVFGNRARLLVEEAISPEDLDVAVLREQREDESAGVAQHVARVREQRERARVPAHDGFHEHETGRQDEARAQSTSGREAVTVATVAAVTVAAVSVSVVVCVRHAGRACDTVTPEGVSSAIGRAEPES